MTANFYENFGLIWERFLNFEINRSREAIKYFGNANSYFILQTVAWHNLHLVQKEEGSREYERLKKQWGNNIFDFGNHIPSKLSILTVSQISGIDKETCRRVVKKLISDGWVTYSRNEGIRYYPTEKNNQLMVKFNEAIEIPLFLNLAKYSKRLVDRNIDSRRTDFISRPKLKIRSAASLAYSIRCSSFKTNTAS